MPNQIITPPLALTVAGQRIFYAGFEAGVSSEGGPLQEDWGSETAASAEAAWGEFRTSWRPDSDEAAPPPEPATGPDAPAADSLVDLNSRVADILRRHYRGTGEAMAWEATVKVLEEVQRTYEELAARAGLHAD